MLMCSRKEIRFSFDFKEKPAAGNMENSTFSSASGGGGGVSATAAAQWFLQIQTYKLA